MMVTAVRLILYVLSQLLKRISAGSAVARYAGQNVHKRLLQEEAYKKKDYAAALKNAFIGTDADMRSSAHTKPFGDLLSISDPSDPSPP